MKCYSLLLFFFCFSFSVVAQKYALIDKKMKTPIIYTDSITVEQVNKGYFPVMNQSIDTLIANVEYIMSMLGERQRVKAERFELHAAATVFDINRVPYAYGDRYDVNAITQIGEVKAIMSLVKNKNSNKESDKELDKFLAYLKSNESFFIIPNEIRPKLYNVVVITD